MGLATYRSIARTTPRIEQSRLDRYLEDRGTLHVTGCWREAPLCGRVANDDDWFDPELSARAWLNRFTPCNQAHQSSRWTDLSQTLLPDICDFVRSLPFLEVTHCNLLLQINPVDAHLDLDDRFGETSRLDIGHLEPTSYKWLLTGFELNSFYLQTALGQPKHYVKLAPDRALVAISEGGYLHGADFNPGHNKYMLSIFGLLDSERHRRLIAQSREIPLVSSTALAPLPPR